MDRDGQEHTGWEIRPLLLIIGGSTSAGANRAGMLM